MANKYDTQITVPVTKEQKERWKEVLPQSDYNSLPAMIRDLMDQTVGMVKENNIEHFVVKAIKGDQIKSISVPKWYY